MIGACLSKGVPIKSSPIVTILPMSTFRSMLSPTQVPNLKVIPMMTKDKTTCPSIPFHLSVDDESLNEVVTLLKTILYQLIIIFEAIVSCVAVIVREFATLKLVNVIPMELAVRYTIMGYVM